MQMKCPQCGYNLDPFDKTCPKCAYLARTGQVSPSAPMPIPLGQPPPPSVQTGTLPTGAVYKVCPNCGQPAVPAMTVCGRCNFQYASQPGIPQQTQAIPPPVITAPYPQALSYSYPTAMGQSRTPLAHRRWAAAIGGVLCLVLLLAFALSFRSSTSQRNGGSALRMVPSGNGNVGMGLVGAAVNTQQFDQRLLNAAAATGGEVEVSLAWNSLTDLDLQVRDPFGELISAVHRRSASGGVQDVDANPTLINEAGQQRADAGLNPGPENVLPLPEMLVDLGRNIGMPDGFPGLDMPSGIEGKAPSRFTRAPVEHIYFAHAPRGTYTVYAHCYSWREPNSLPLPFTVQVRSFGKVFYTASGTLGPASYITDNTVPAQVCQFVIR